MGSAVSMQYTSVMTADISTDTSHNSNYDVTRQKSKRVLGQYIKATSTNDTAVGPLPSDLGTFHHK